MLFSVFVMLFHRQNNKMTIFTQAIDSLNVPILSALGFILFKAFSKIPAIFEIA